MDEFKKCNICKQTLPIQRFQASKNSKHKDCVRCYKKQYYAKNKKRIRAKKKAYSAKQRLENKKKGITRWGSNFEDEKNKFQAFLEEHNITINFKEH